MFDAVPLPVEFRILVDGELFESVTPVRFKFSIQPAERWFNNLSCYFDIVS